MVNRAADLMVRRRPCAVSNHERERVSSFETRRKRRSSDEVRHVCAQVPKCPTPPAPPSLQELRKEIDAIDEQVHRLLMARGDIIDRLIQVKQTQEVGSAFRPAREAEHDAAAGRSAIAASCRSTPSRASGASSSRPSPTCRRRSRCMRMSRSANPRCGIRRGFISASSCPMSRISARRPRSRRWRNRRAIWRWSRRSPAARRGGSRSKPSGAPKIIARLPFLERADHPAALPVFVVSRVADDAMVTEVEMWSVRVSGWNADIARALSPLAEIVAVPDTAFDGAALLVSDCRHRASRRSSRP